MEVKKSPKANLEGKKAVFTQIGLVVVLSIVLIAFEWTWSDYNVDINLSDNDAAVEEEIIPITRQDDTPPPPPPPPAAADILNIVENNMDLDDELEILIQNLISQLQLTIPRCISRLRKRGMKAMKSLCLQRKCLNFLADRKLCRNLSLRILDIL